MKLVSLPENSSIFVDGNIFLFTILAHPKFKEPCEKFLAFLESKEYRAFTSTLVLNEVIHKLMITEAIKKHALRTEHDAYLLLRQKPEVIRGLTITWDNFSSLKGYPIKILSISNSLDSAIEISKSYGLLISDAMHAALCREHKVENIATADADFEGVVGIKVEIR
jgi:predicted nucleic acid-binding protein